MSTDLGTKFVGFASAPQGSEVVSAEGRVSGYAAIFTEEDYGGDVITPGAFKALPKTLPMLWAHDPSVVIGVWDDIQVDTKGLKVSGRLMNGISKADETRRLLEANAVGGLSIGYFAREKNFKTLADGRKVRYITELEVFEVSVTPTPMMRLARVTGSKAVNPLAELASWLRDFRKQQE
jgi:uncharacterized protein